MPERNDQTQKTEPTGRAKVAKWIILMLLPFTALIFFGCFKGWTWMTGNWDKVLGVVFGLEGIVTFILADFASKKTDRALDEIRGHERKIVKTLDDIQRTEQLLAKDVVNLEDATRRNLSGFAEIFDRSIWLLERADEEIIYANFALGFGNPHKSNVLVADSFSRLEHKKSDWLAFSKAVDAFWITLQRKAGTITKLKIVTLTQEAYEDAFIVQLSTRGGYDYLKNVATKNELCKKEGIFKTALIDTLNGRVGQREGDDQKKLKMTEEWRVGKSLPVQILICGLSGAKDTPQETRRGCVVFLLGTESVAGVKKPGSETGFYTELPHIIKMYEDLIDNVAEGFEVIEPRKASLLSR